MGQSKEKNSQLTCDCCHNEVPLSAALTPEGMDYVRHFCGTDCLEKWRKQQKKEEPKE
jgi:hypothetical protein